MVVSLIGMLRYYLQISNFFCCCKFMIIRRSCKVQLLPIPLIKHISYYSPPVTDLTEFITGLTSGDMLIWWVCSSGGLRCWFSYPSQWNSAQWLKKSLGQTAYFWLIDYLNFSVFFNVFGETLFLPSSP